MAEADVELLKQRLMELLVEYCKKTQELLPELFKLSNMRDEINVIIVNLKANNIKFDVDKIAEEAGLSLEDVKNSIEDLQKVKSEILQNKR